MEKIGSIYKIDLLPITYFEDWTYLTWNVILLLNHITSQNVIVENANARFVENTV